MLLVPMLALALIQDPGVPTEAGLRERWQVLRISSAEQRAALARWSLDHALFREAGLLARDALRVIPGHAIKEITAELGQVDATRYANQYRAALKQSGREYKKRYRQIREPVSRSLVKMAREADDAGWTALADALYVDALGADPDNGKATAALRKRDYDLIYNYGAVPRADKVEARRSLRRLGGDFLGRRDLAPYLEFWTDAWGLETRHYVFVTNAPHATVFRFAQACEDLHAYWEVIMKDARVATRKLRDPLVVYFFDTPQTYEAILRSSGLDAPTSTEVLGFYAGDTKIGYFYDSPDYYEGDLTLLFETFYHEGTHQLCDLRMKAAWRGMQASFPISWIEEGFATYMETFEVIDVENEAREFNIGAFLDDDLAIGVDAFLSGELMDLEDFLHCSPETFDGYEYAYQHAVLLSHFFLESKGGAHRRAFFTILQETTKQGGLKEAVYGLVKSSKEELEAEVRAHVKQLSETLPRRKYFGDDDD